VQAISCARPVGISSAWADVCGGLPAGLPKRLEYYPDFGGTTGVALRRWQFLEGAWLTKSSS